VRAKLIDKCVEQLGRNTLFTFDKYVLGNCEEARNREVEKVCVVILEIDRKNGG